MASAMMTNFTRSLGFETVSKATKDSKILFVQRFVRMFAYGATTIVLANFLSLLKVSDVKIGLFMTLTLLGDVILSFILTVFADGIGRRNVLVMGSVMMILSGVVFAMSSSYWLLVFASVFGVISPSGAEIGPFRATEESMLATLAPKESLSDFYAWYTLFASAGAAFGSLLSGVVVQGLQSYSGWSELSAQRAIFAIYAGLGIVKLLLSLALTVACEAEPTRDDVAYQAIDEEETEGRVTMKKSVPLVQRVRNLLPTISEASRPIIFRLCLLIGIDSFSSSLVNESWMTYFFIKVHHITGDVLGTLFFVSNIAASLSNLVAASLTKRLGLVRTMVYTHLPSALFLSLIPFPSQSAVSAMFMVLRRCTSQMDQAPRQAFISAVITPGERTAVMGTINVCKTFAQSIGPILTGYLVENNKFWVAFVMAGTLKASYDLTMLKMFQNTQV